ncbi:hypothetical protein TEA_018983 [Camellia sinensis var. sinensis]|uniref:Di19 C-terminal domain-containing protein n=1 Tax=Camellia sinensis var. sinensis TaxID=542762 RepID=A0A4S4DPI9_CAMSN|nr:hypothetical protein TEA_018983 [Camellia sinensis var. sinensis]
MDDERYLVLSTSSNHTMVDLHIDIEDESDEEDDDLKTDYVCPFCLDDFDLVGFCCHIDDGHPIEAKSGESSCVVSSSDMDADPLLSSFIYNPPAAEESEILQPSFTTEANLAKKSSDENMLERNIDPSPLSNKDQEEKAQRCEFVQGLLYSTIFKDDL